MHDSYLDSAKPHYFAAIVLGAFCWFKPHPFASSKAVLYTKRDCCEITIFLLSTITPRVCFFRGGQKKKNKSCFIFLGALQSPWRLFKMRLKRHAAVRKELIFSVTHWVIESLQARWPALVKIISRVHPISNDRGKKKRRRRREEQNIHSRDIQHDWVWLHDLLTPTHLPVRGSLFTPPAFFFIFFFLYKPPSALAHHRVFGAQGIFLVLLWVMFLIWIIYPRETRLWMLALVFKEHLVCS